MKDVHAFMVRVTSVIVALSQSEKHSVLPIFLVKAQVSDHGRINFFFPAFFPPVVAIATLIKLKHT